MEIQASMVYDYKTYRDFNLFHFFKGKNYKLKRSLFWVLLGVSFLQAVLGTIFPYYLSDSTFTIWLGFGMFSLFLFFIYYVSPKISFNSAKKLSGAVSEFVFSEDELSVVSGTIDFSGTTKMKYSLLYKVYETEKYFFIYINLGQAFIINKSALTGGSSEQLRAIISSHLPLKKYVLCK